QIEGEDVVLGEIVLEARRQQDLLQLALPALLRAEEEVLHHLLRDGGCAESLAAAERVDHRGAGQREEVEARVLVEVLVLRADHGLHEHARDLIHLHHRAALPVELADHAAVGGHHLAGDERVVVANGIECRDLARDVDVPGEHREDAGHGQRPSRPGSAAQDDFPAGRSGGDVALVVVRGNRAVWLHLRLGRWRRRFRGPPEAAAGRLGGEAIGLARSMQQRGPLRPCKRSTLLFDLPSRCHPKTYEKLAPARPCRHPAPAMWCVYLLRCADGTLYTGITTDLHKRLAAHARGRGARYTRGRAPLTLLHAEPACTRSAALRREHELKRLP